MQTNGLPPELAANARVLVLGSLPGIASLQAAEYYAHPRNVFWDIVEDLFGIARKQPYRERLAALHARGVALWDVLAASRRMGSLDAAIERGTEIPNDFATVLPRMASLRLLAFNGRKAAELFGRHVDPSLAAGVETLTLPSTSPAHAAMQFTDKLAAWRVIHAAASGRTVSAPAGPELRRTL